MFGIDDALLFMGGSSILSGVLGSNAAGDAADATRDAANTSAGVQRDMFNMIMQNLSPWTSGGADAMRQLMFLSGASPLGNFIDKDKLRAKFTTGGSPGTPSVLQGTWTPAYGPEGTETGGVYTYPDGTTGTSPTKSVTGSGNAGVFDREGYLDALGRKKDKLRDNGYGSLTQSIDDEFKVKPFSYTVDDFKKGEEYKFLQGEGEQAIMRAQNAMGSLRGTGTLKALSRFNQGLASTEYNKAYTRELGTYTTNYGTKLQEFMTNLGIKVGNMERPFNMLSTLSGMGLNAGAQTGSAGMNMANNTSAGILQAGAAAGQAAIGSAGAWSQAIQGGIGNYLTMDRWNQMLPLLRRGG